MEPDMQTDSLLCERCVRKSKSEYVQNGDDITSGMESGGLAQS